MTLRAWMAGAAVVVWAGASGAGPVEMVFTCARCACQCVRPDCRPPGDLPAPCAADSPDLGGYEALCRQTCARGGAVGALEIFQQLGAPCPPCPGASVAAPAAGGAGLAALAGILLALGARRCARSP